MSRRFVASWIGLAYLFLSAAPLWSQETLRWETDLATAQRLAAETNRLVLVHFWATWCGPCMHMEREVFSKPGLGTSISPYYVPVKVQCEDGFDNPVAKQFGVQAFPSDVVMTAQGQIVHRSKGVQSAEAYVTMLQQTAQAALAQARTVGATSEIPSSTPPAIPAAPAAVPAPPALPSAPSARTAPSDDRYANYRERLSGQSTTATAPPVGLGHSAVAPPAPPITATPATPTVPNSVAPTTAPSASILGDRYATGDRYSRVEPQVPPVAPPAPPISAPVAPQAPIAAAPPSAPPTVTAPPAPAVAPSNVTAANLNVPPSGPQLPPGCPPAALDGYCPVTLTEKMSWKRGDVKYGAIHRGRTYLFLSAVEQQKFLADPDRYSPVMSGNDPVVALEQGETVNGSRKYGLMYENRMFLFSSKESYDKFCKDSKRYGAQTFQAMQAAGDTTLRR